MSGTLEAMLSRDRAAAARWAKEVLEDERTVILDTETTGLVAPMDFVETGMVDRKGRQVFHSLVAPHCPIGEEATRIHGYAAKNLRGMPTFCDLFEALQVILLNRRVIVYNAPYDRMVLEYAMSHYDIMDFPGESLPPWECAMRRYAEYVGDWNEKRRSYRWQRLEGGDHSAIGDARACLRVIRRMAETLDGEGM